MVSTGMVSQITASRRYASNPNPKIKLSGIGIKQNHAIFVGGDNDNEIILKPNEAEAIRYIYINGKKIKTQDGQKLNNKDRIVFGSNTIMIFMEKQLVLGGVSAYYGKKIVLKNKLQ